MEPFDAYQADAIRIQELFFNLIQEYPPDTYPDDIENETGKKAAILAIDIIIDVLQECKEQCCFDSPAPFEDKISEWNRIKMYIETL